MLELAREGTLGLFNASGQMCATCRTRTTQILGRKQRSPHVHAAPRGQARDAALRRPPTGGGGQHREGLPDRVVEAGGADLLEIDRVPLAQEREFFADGLSGGPIVAECLDRRLGCPPNRRPVPFMLEIADA